MIHFTYINATIIPKQRTLASNALKCYEKVGVGKIMVSEMTCKIFVGCTLQVLYVHCCR
jgi:hypothetical protein